MADEQIPSEKSFISRQRTKSLEASSRARNWVTVRRDDTPTVDLAVHLYERDRETFAAVLGSAIALRLFLFFVPVMVAVVGLINLIVGSGRISDLLDQANVGGRVASQIAGATRTTTSGSLWIVFTGVFGAIWAGRSLTKVLAACAAGSWQITGSKAKATIRMAGLITGLLFVALVATSVLNRVRQDAGIAVAATSLVVVGVVYTAAWFTVSWVLPRGTPDPGALLPGAALFGIGMALLQWFMQFYLPDKISRSSQVMGSLGLAVAVLGYLFFIGRLMAMSFVLDAVVYEKVGSISELLFGVPVLRRIPRRWPSIARFFDLADATADVDADPDAPARDGAAVEDGAAVDDPR